MEQVDIDKYSDLALSEGVRSVPTFRIVKHGKRLKEILGANEAELESSVKQFCKARGVEF